jgi:hypothetical protein
MRQGLAVLVLAVSAIANAQYFFTLEVPPAGPVRCDSDSVEFGAATYSWNLPPPPDNVVNPAFVNGIPVPDYPDIQTQVPTSGRATESSHISPLGRPGTPYTVEVTAFPAINGNPVGTGIRIRVQCDALGADQGKATFSVVEATASVIEYYNAGLDHYFITWLPAEIAILDAGTQIKGWKRTGYSFKTYPTAQYQTSPVCRYYIPPGLGDSHFFGRGTAECNATGQKNPSFVLEDPAFMRMFLPAAGVCPAGTTQVYRVFSNRPDANHRYMTDKAVRDQMVAKGWLAEGDGPDLVVMCAPQ